MNSTYFSKYILNCIVDNKNISIQKEYERYKQTNICEILEYLTDYIVYKGNDENSLKVFKYIIYWKCGMEHICKGIGYGGCNAQRLGKKFGGRIETVMNWQCKCYRINSKY